MLYDGNAVGRARYWLPCVDFPQVRQSLEFLLTSEESHTLVANGVLQSEVTKNGRKTAHWKLDFACPSYLACIAAGEVRSLAHACPCSGARCDPVWPIRIID